MLDRTANSISAVSSSWRWIRACAGRCSLAHPCLGSYRARRLTAVPGMPALLGHSIMEWLSRTHGATASDPRLRQQLAEAKAIDDFASREFGLPDNDNDSYRACADLGRP